MGPNGIVQIQQWVSGFAATQIVLCCDSLGVFEALRNGPLSLPDLSAALNLPADSLERLLIAGCALQMLLRKGDSFSLTPLSQTHLLPGGQQYAGGMFHHIKHHLYPLWNHLEEAIREDRPQWARLPGKNDDPFASMYQDPAALRGFMEAMFSQTLVATRELLEHFSFEPFRHIMDVGGAAGGFLIPVLQRYPQLRGTIFDLAAVQPVAQEKIAAARLEGRIQFVAGDFFRDPLPHGADLIVLGHILHDWSREDGTRLLQAVRTALPSGGAVFVNEHFLDDTRDGPFFPAFLNLNMLVATHGKERTAADYEAWLQQAGFQRTQSWRGDSPRGYVLGWKA